MSWRRLNGEQIEDLVASVEETILRELSEGNRLTICIGTDSQVYGTKVEFATAIVFLRAGRGGFMFVNKEMRRNLTGIRQRMLDEVARSIETAYSLVHVLERYEVPLEVHADINTDPAFQSNVALKEAMGYIMGMGYEFKAKPNAFASTNCANKIVH